MDCDGGIAAHLPDHELIMDFKITLQYEIDNTFTFDLSERAEFFGWANTYISSVAQKMIEIRSTM
jgi:hypothetical protein